MRLKSLASLQNKIEKYYRGKLSGRIPIQKCVNDILGFRIILKQDCSQEPSFIQMCDDHKRNNIIRKYYFKDDSGYRGMHIYFNAQSNLFFRGNFRCGMMKMNQITIVRISNINKHTSDKER